MELQKPIAERELEAVADLSRVLARARDPEAVARVLLQRVLEAMPAGFAGLSLLEDGAARGLLGLLHGQEVDWWTGMRLDLAEPSGIATAARERRPVAVADCEASAIVNPRLVEFVGAHSAAFVPMLSDERVIGVLSVATTEGRHDFSQSELALLQALAAEAGLALERSSSEAQLAKALERERLVASIGRRVRSELDLDAALTVTTRETGRALGLIRCFVRLGEPGGPMPIASEWDAPGVQPVGHVAERLPVSNLASQERRTVAVADVEHDPLLDDSSLGGRAGLYEIGTRAVLATPIVVFDRMIGVFSLHRAEPWAWSDAEIGLAEAVAREAGLAVHTAEILSSNRQRLSQQQALLKAAQAVTSELRLETVLNRLVAELARLLGADAADCYFLHPDRGILRCAAVHGLDHAVVGWEFPADKGLGGQALRSGTAVLSENYEELRFEVPHPAYEGFARAIVAPMGWAGEVRGIVGVGTRDPQRAYRAPDVEAVEVFASLAGLAVRNAESFERHSRQAQVQRGFYRIAAILSEPLSHAETLHAVAEAACEALGGRFAAVLAIGAEGLRVLAEHELPVTLARKLESASPSSVAVLQGCAAGRLLSFPTVARDERLGTEIREAADGVFASLLALPLEQRESGGVVLVFFPEERQFVDDDLELARQVSRAARGALERSDLYEAERTAHALSRQLARTGNRLATELDPGQVIAEVVQHAPELLGADAAALWQVADHELILRAGEGEGVPSEVGARIPDTTRPVGDVVQSAAPVAVSSLDGDLTSGGDPLLRDGRHRAWIGVPLVGEGGLYGVLAVYSSAAREWRAAEVQALEALAGGASSALANAQLYQRVAVEKERLDAVLSSVADGIVAVDRDGAVVLWNAAAERITDVPAAEALGRRPDDILQRSLSGAEAPGGERLLSLMRGGEELWLSLTEAVMRDPAGAISGRVYAFRDVSSERSVEQLKSDFVASVSHELRAPLTSIFGFAETLLGREGLFGETERRIFLRYIASEAERLTSIVEQLLNVARLEAGDLEVAVETVDVGPIVRDAVEQVERMAAGDGHRFETELSATRLAARADGAKLRQVVANLLDNAVKFSPGGGHIRVAARRRANRVEIEIADEGLGIPQAEHELIFRKFYRAQDPLGETRGGPGAGLGLFIVRGLIRAMGGRIWVSSVEGQGSRFAFELPLAASERREAGAT